MSLADFFLWSSYFKCLSILCDIMFSISSVLYIKMYIILLSKLCMWILFLSWLYVLSMSGFWSLWIFILCWYWNGFLPIFNWKWVLLPELTVYICTPSFLSNIFVIVVFFLSNETINKQLYGSKTFILNKNFGIVINTKLISINQTNLPIANDSDLLPSLTFYR